MKSIEVILEQRDGLGAVLPQELVDKFCESAPGTNLPNLREAAAQTYQQAKTDSTRHDCFLGCTVVTSAFLGDIALSVLSGQKMIEAGFSQYQVLGGILATTMSSIALELAAAAKILPLISESIHHQNLSKSSRRFSQDLNDFCTCERVNL